MSHSSSENYALIDQLAEEFAARYRAGEHPTLQEYIDRHPQLADEIRDLLPAMLEIEQVKLDIRAPAEQAAAPVPLPVQQLGDFHILREIGHGGMGVVYEAEQVSLGRRVALKVLPRLLVDPKQKQRFEREAKAAAKLHHTNIVPVFGVGEHDGLAYYVMQFIQGLGLDEVIEELQRLRSGSRAEPAATAAGELRVSRKDVSAANMAHSLLTGAFQTAAQGDDHGPARATGTIAEAVPAASPVLAGSGASASQGETATARLSDTFALSSSSGILSGVGRSGRVQAKRLRYWQSVAQVGVQVSEALDYAHKQGVLHRDVKPSNLLLDTGGTAWVTDFGLAKADDQKNLTHTGDILGTLRYMPPEAFEGHTDPRSDVYSLGLTLYELLALRPAFEERDRNRLIKQVTTEEPPRLSRLNPAVPRDLVTIVHKAIDRDPAHRYQTAGELAADLQRFIEDEPIKARRLGLRERAGRWCRHHPGVAGLTAAIAVLLLAVTVASVLAAAHFDQLARRATQAAADEREAREREAQLREEAEQQRQRAEANLATARAAVDAYFTKVSESQLLRVPGLQELRGELLQAALTFYQGFLKERGDDLSLRAEMAAVHRRVGLINIDLGREAEARAALEAAIAEYEAALGVNPGNTDLQKSLADSWEALGDLEHSLGRSPQIRLPFEKATALREALARAHPENAQYQKELATTYNRLGIAQSSAQQHAQAFESYRRSTAIRLELARVHADDPALQYGLGESFLNLGTFLANGHPQEALAMYLRSQEFYRAACAKVPHMIEYGLDLASTHQRAGRMYWSLGRQEEALAQHQLAVDHLTRMARDNPSVPQVSTRLVAALRTLAPMQLRMGDGEAALGSLRQAATLVEKLPGRAADNLFLLACVWAQCASLFGQEEAGQRREAELAVAALRQALAAGYQNVAQLKKAKDLAPLRGREDFKELVRRVEDQAKTVTAGKAAPPRPAAQPTVKQEPAAKPPPPAADSSTTQPLQADLATSQLAIGLIQADLGQTEESVKSLAQALAIRDTMVKDTPQNVQYRLALALAHLTAGDVHWKGGRLAEGAQSWQKGAAALEEAVGKQPGDATLSQRSATIFASVADRYARQALWPEAAVFLRRAAELMPGDHYHAFRLAHLLVQIGDREGYRRVCRELVERFGNDKDALSAPRAGQACLLLPGSDVDPGKLTQLAELGVTRTGKHPGRVICQGMTAYRTGKLAESIRLIEEGLQGDSQAHFRVRGYFFLAMAQHQLGKTDDARKALEQGRTISANELGSQDAANWHDWLLCQIARREAEKLIEGSSAGEMTDHLERGQLYFRLGEREKSEAAFASALAVRPNDPQVWLARGRVFAQRGQRDRAEADFTRAVELKPKDPQAWQERGRIYAELGQHDKAAADFIQALELSPQDGSPSSARRQVYLELAPWDAVFSRVAEQRPTDARLWSARGHFHSERSQWDEALAALGKAIERSPTDPEFRIARSILFARAEQWEKVAAELAKAIELGTTESAVWPRYGWVQLHLGDGAGHRRTCADLLTRFGQTEDLHAAEMLARLCIQVPNAVTDYAPIVKLAEKAVAAKPQAFTLHNVLGGALFRAGQPEAAVRQLQEAVQVGRGGSPYTWLFLALTHARLDNLDEARRWLAKADDWYQQRQRERQKDPQGLAPGTWHQPLEYQVLRREAAALLAGKQAGRP